jgi:predicted cupin superfamily sugar epimerase
MKKLTPDDIRRHLKLQPNPAEGGFFASTYTSAIQLPVNVLQGFATTPATRRLCSAIFYFLDTNTFSALHRVTSDMIYHFYSGHPVQMLLLHPPGSAPRSETCIFGNDLDKGQVPMKVIPGGTWLGSRLLHGDYALMGVTMAPGFDPADYTIAKREDLLKEYTDAKTRDLIIALTRI